MNNKQRNQGRAASFSGGIACGVMLAILITVVGAAVLAKLIDMQTLEWEHVGYGIMAILMLSSFAAAKTAAGKVKRRKLLVCSVSGIAYFGMMLAITALFFGGQYYGIAETMLLIMCGSGVAALLSLDNRRGKHRKKQFAGAKKI